MHEALPRAASAVTAAPRRVERVEHLRLGACSNAGSQVEDVVLNRERLAAVIPPHAQRLAVLLKVRPRAIRKGEASVKLRSKQQRWHEFHLELRTDAETWLQRACTSRQARSVIAAACADDAEYSRVARGLRRGEIAWHCGTASARGVGQARNTRDKWEGAFYFRCRCEVGEHCTCPQRVCTQKEFSRSM